MAGVPTDIGNDQELPLYDTEFPPAETATQNVEVGQETEVSVPPTPVGCAFDHFPLRQLRADPFSSTATQNELDAQETPYKDVLPEAALDPST